MLLRNDMRGLLYLEPRFLFVLDFRVVPLEDDGIVLFFQRGLVMLRQGGPQTIMAPRRAHSRTAQFCLSGHQAIKSGRAIKLPKQWLMTNAWMGFAPSLR